MKQLIINADDFGWSHEVNAAILRTSREGVLTGTSLMVAGAARDEAVAIARECPDLDVGLHLVVCRGSSVLPSERLGGLVNRSSQFGENPVLTGLKYFFDRRLRASLRDEIRAQIDTHLNLIGYLYHLDGHLNFHVHPAIARMLIEIASEYRIPCMRLPREPLFTTLWLAHDHAPRKVTEAIIFRTLSRHMLKLMQSRGIFTTDRLFGLHQTGHLSEEYVAAVIRQLPEGTTEMYFHPASCIGGLSPSPAAQLETRILTSPRIRAALAAAEVNRTNFAQLAKRANLVA